MPIVDNNTNTLPTEEEVVPIISAARKAAFREILGDWKYWTEEDISFLLDNISDAFIQSDLSPIGFMGIVIARESMLKDAKQPERDLIENLLGLSNICIDYYIDVSDPRVGITFENIFGATDWVVSDPDD